MQNRGSADRLSPTALEAWQGFIRLHAQLDRLLDVDLQAGHQMSGNDYDVLIQLGIAPHRRLRLTELARQTLLSPSGITRLVDDLERRGLVRRERREDDARSFDAILTSAGRTRLKAANRTHLRRIRETFLDRLTAEQLQHLAGCWAAVDPELVTGPSSDAGG